MTQTLIQKLRDSGLVPARELDEAERQAAAIQGSVVHALAGRADVPFEPVAMLVAYHHDLPFAHLVPDRVASDVLRQIPLARWTEFRALPIEQKGSAVQVAVADPEALGDIPSVLQKSELTVELVVAPLPEIDAELVRNERIALGAVPQEDAVLLEAGGNQLALALTTADAPRAVEILVGLAVDMQASDIHISWESEGMVVRFRKDGSLRSLRHKCPETDTARVISAFKVQAGLDITDKRHAQDGRTRLTLHSRSPQLSVLARVATLPCRQGEKLAIRILESGAKLMELPEIGLTKGNLTKVREALRFPNGLFLVTGPTGSGKTTTLYAALRHLAHDQVSVFTIEDPIEFELPGAYQSQVNEAAGITFPSLVRALLRQDPDIILLGEIRDDETAQTALMAALSGRLVLSSLHSNSAVTAVTRLIDMGVEPFVLGSCTRAIIGQRLVRKLCHCKRPVYRMSERHVRIKEALGLSGSSLFEPVGCPSCFFTGFHGRVAVHELLTFDRELADLVMAKATSTELLDAARNRGFKVMAHDGFSKVFSGLTTVAEVERQVGPAPGLEA
ncbi:MAG: type II/IV secretion system protein [Candidatus Wallbacteria bacterium]|nr:type II/IV secretion system protein [Candidatus Wallbacteria bacterium]